MIEILIKAILLVTLLIPLILNAQVGSFKTADSLRNQIGQQGVQALTNGRGTMGDNQSGIYMWSDTATLADDGINVLKNPTRNTGRWMKLKFGTSTVQGLIDSLAALKTFTQNIGKFPIWDKTGLRSEYGKLFTDTFSISTATPTISLTTILSAMGCSNFKIIAATGFRAGATTNNAPNVAVTGVTSNSVSLIFNQTNTAVVSILGINVLSGLPFVLVPDPANIKAVLSFYAW